MHEIGKGGKGGKGMKKVGVFVNNHAGVPIPCEASWI